MVKELRTGRFNFFFGASPTIFGVGFDISKYSINLNLTFFWISVEW